MNIRVCGLRLVAYVDLDLPDRLVAVNAYVIICSYECLEYYYQRHILVIIRIVVIIHNSICLIRVNIIRNNTANSMNSSIDIILLITKHVRCSFLGVATRRSHLVVDVVTIRSCRAAATLSVSLSCYTYTSVSLSHSLSLSLRYQSTMEGRRKLSLARDR